MMSLFSSFDLYFFITSITLTMVMVLNFFNNYMKVNFISTTYKMFFFYVETFLSSLKPKSFSKIMIFIFCNLMILNIILNFSSVLSFNFPLNSQFGMVFFISFSIWSTMVIFQLSNNFKGVMYHFIPEGCPLYLTWLLFLIELISNIIRPITLSIRLVANILAGHLLMILLSKLVMSYGLMFFLYIILNIVELFVAMIQSYIFMTMISLYYSEMN